MSADQTPEAQGLQEQLDEGYRLIGRSPVKVDGMSKTTGATQFADDLTLPRMLHCKLYRSPVAHARIKSIDTSAAEAMPGVVAVLTGEALPTSFGILPVSQDEHALCLDKVRFVGDPVAAVAAIDEETAFDAMNAIQVEYEPLEAVYEPAKSMKNEIEPIHDYGDDGNVHKRVSMQFGDVDAAMDDADLVLEHDYFYEGNTHLPMEQHATLAFREPDGRVTIWSSTQTPHYLHRAASKVLGLPASRVRIVACPNGGGFGGKSDPFNHEIAVAKLAMMTNRPVKICLTREEVFYCHRGRHPVQMHCKTGFNKDGAMTGMHFQSLLDGGAYGSYGVASTYYTGALQTVTYKVPTYRFDGVRTFTNKPPCGPKRGHGTPQPRFALEVQLDRAAEALDIDPAEIRLRHLQPPHSNTANWLRIGSMGLGACIEKVVEGSGWKDKFRKLPSGKGIGLACSSYICGAGLPIYWNAMPHSGVTLQLDRGGGVALFCGETDIGQGSDTVLAMCAAEVLGVDLEDVRIHVADTAYTPVDLGSYSSRVTLMVGNAAIQAAERAREIVAKEASKQLQVPGNRLRFADNRVFDVQDPEKGLAFSQAVGFAEAAHGTIATAGSYAPPPTPGRYRGAGVGPSPAYSYSAAVVEVDVDAETGCRRGGEGLDRARHRPVHQRDARDRPGRRAASTWGWARALMRGDGVSRQPLRRAQDPVAARVQEPDDEGDARRGDVPRRGPGSERARLVPRRWARARCSRSCRPSPMPSTTLLAFRVDEVPIGPEKVLRALERKDKRYGPKAMPDLRITERPCASRPEDEGGGRHSARGPTKKKEKVTS